MVTSIVTQGFWFPRDVLDSEEEMGFLESLYTSHMDKAATLHLFPKPGLHCVFEGVVP